MTRNGTYNNFISLLTLCRSEQKWEVFAQFWEVVRSKTSHIPIDNQWNGPELRSNKKLRSLGSSRGRNGHVHSAGSYPVTAIFAGIISNSTHGRHPSYGTFYQHLSFGVAGTVGTTTPLGFRKVFVASAVAGALTGFVMVRNAKRQS